MPAPVRYEFYRKLFKENRDLTIGMVAGFYYKDRAAQEAVLETGDLISYQTIEKQSDYICKEFTEFRCYQEVPSKMWGDQVVEVWKFLIRS